jgi:polyhydroxyalkanoate synthesis regulator phasin
VDTRLLTSREALAKAARISSSQVKLIEAIQNQAAPEVVAAVKSGDLSLAAAAAVATLPAEEQVQAAQAGVKELKQAAKRVREANRKPRAEPALDDSDADAASAEAAPAESVEALRARIRELEAENATLRAQLAQLQGAA